MRWSSYLHQKYALSDDVQASIFKTSDQRWCHMRKKREVYSATAI
jgi:hypothetical protein